MKKQLITISLVILFLHKSSYGGVAQQVLSPVLYIRSDYDITKVF